MGNTNSNRNTSFYFILQECLTSGFFLSGVVLALLVWLVDPFIDAVFLQQGTIYQQLTVPEASEKYFRLVVSGLILIFSATGSVLINHSRRTREDFNRTTSHLNAIINTETDCVKTVSKDGTLLSMNPAGLALIGAKSFNEVEGLCVYDLVTPEFRDDFIDLNKRVFAGETVELEFEITGLNGDHKWVDTHATPLTDDSGTIMAHLAVTRNITRRKEIEETLRENERQLIEAQHMAHVGSWHWDITSDMIKWSDEVYRIYGLSREDVPVLTRERIMEALHPDDRDRIYQNIDQTVDLGIGNDNEYRLIRPDGSIRTVSSRREVKFDKDGKVASLAGTVQDITERKLEEEATRKNQKRLRDAQRIAMLGFWEVDIVRDTTFWSEEIYTIFGVNPDIFTPDANSIAELIYPDDRESVRCAIEAALHDDIPFNMDYRIVRPDGALRHIHTQGELIRDDNGAPLYRLGTLIDITARKLAEDALLKNHQLLSSVIEAPQDMIYVKDVEGRFLVANSALAEFLGRSKEEIIGKTNADIFPPDAARRADQEDEEILSTGKPNTYEHTMEIGGEKRTRLSEKAIFRDDEGNILGLVGISRDITERKRIEDALKKSQRLFEEAEEIGRIGHWEWDYLEDRLVDCSEQYARIHGLTMEEMLTSHASYKQDQAMIHPGDIERFNKAETAARESLKGLNIEYRIITAQGQLLHVQEISEFEVDATGKIIRTYGTLQDITERKQAEEELSYQASHDTLTGLVNRYEFERRAKHLLETISTKSDEHALCYLDLDQFKVVNDTCGHPAGDELLHQLGAVLREKVRKTDTLARLGGDEFGVLMEDCSMEHALRVANSMLQVIQDYQFSWEGQIFRLGASLGLVAITKEAIPNLSELMKQADAACYMAKDLGRNRIHMYREEDSTMAQRKGEMRWVTRIYQALEDNRFCLYAQPIVPLDNSNKEHYELLIRMKDEKGKLIPPGAFLPAAERYNLIAQLDRWVIEHAFRLLALNPGFQQKIEFISINLSGQSLADDSFQEYVTHQFEASDIAPSRICFEITETTAISDLNTANKFISKMKTQGCKFALDDFGSGLSSFAYLKNLPVDYLKIDGMFVKDIIEDPIDRAMVKSINEIGHVMGMHTIAEFVENDVIKGMLTQIGVDYAQGYGIGKPQPFDELLCSPDNKKTATIVKINSK